MYIENRFNGIGVENMFEGSEPKVLTSHYVLGAADWHLIVEMLFSN